MISAANKACRIADIGALLPCPVSLFIHDRELSEFHGLLLRMRKDNG